MLSLVELKALSQIFGACCRTHCLPLDWDPVNYQLRVTRSRSKLYMSKMLLAWKLVYTVAIFLRLNPDLTWNLCERRIEQQVFHALLAISSVNISNMWLTLSLFPEEICLLFNRLILFNRQQGRKIVVFCLFLDVVTVKKWGLILYFMIIPLVQSYLQRI